MDVSNFSLGKFKEENPKMREKILLDILDSLELKPLGPRETGAAVLSLELLKDFGEIVKTDRDGKVRQVALVGLVYGLCERPVHDGQAPEDKSLVSCLIHAAIKDEDELIRTGAQQDVFPALFVFRPDLAYDMYVEAESLRKGGDSEAVRANALKAREAIFTSLSDAVDGPSVPRSLRQICILRSCVAAT